MKDTLKTYKDYDKNSKNTSLTVYRNKKRTFTNTTLNVHEAIEVKTVKYYLPETACSVTKLEIELPNNEYVTVVLFHNSKDIF